MRTRAKVGVPGTDPVSTVVVSPGEEIAVIADALVRHGATPADARVQAETLVEGDLRGHASHGIRRLPVLVGRLRAGLAVSGVEPEFSWRTDAALAVDGRRALGPVAAHRALDLILDRAATTGVAIASIRNSGHVGMLAPYLERIVATGNAGIALTTSEALVHPWGGATAMVGTNPIGIGIPTLDEPFILDMSTSQVSVGKLLDYAARGEAIPPGWAVDEAGRPTTDAAAGARGALSPFGGAKGYALGLAVEALVGVLAGSAYGRDVHGTLDVEHPPSKGDVFVVFALDALGASASLGGLTSYFDAVRASGSDSPVSIPGDRARRERATRMTEGIPLDAALWDRALALRNGD
jgi:L-2-hydroxycarboxylate dehydrogenase (NAD+)